MSGKPTTRTYVPETYVVLSTGFQDMSRGVVLWYQGRKYTRTIQRHVGAVAPPPQNISGKRIVLIRHYGRHVHVWPVTPGHSHFHYYRKIIERYYPVPF